MTSIFVFHRDLRLEDNLGLLRALEEQKVVYLIFILDERQFENNPYRSDKALIFLFDSLSDLNSELKKKKIVS
jgi:deoxyribodipyrimidine photo-lyase